MTVSERCIVRIKFTPAGSGREVRQAVGGFLRYVQHRDIHPDSKIPRPTPEVAGLLKYVAYRDRASFRAELFGLQGALGSKERKEFAEFVARSVEDSAAQPFRSKDGRIMDRRRAVSRLIISPERAAGLDLDRLTRAAVARLESEIGISDLRWIAAIHRNTKHHHVHLVIAGMAEDGRGGYRRVDITKPRLAAMKESVAREIERQRSERMPTVRSQAPPPPSSESRSRQSAEIAPPRLSKPAQPGALRVVAGARTRLRDDTKPGYHARHSTSVLALRAVARRYAWQMQRETEEQTWRRNVERAA